jgi:Trk K+ transport system NAD-binding subunit
VLESVRAAGLPVVVVDLNTSPDDPRLHGARAVKGDCRRADVLEAAGVKDAGGVVIVTSDDLVNVSAALLVRKLNPTARVVVRMFNQNLLDRFGTAVKNTVALSVSGLTAPLLALTAVTGDALGAFKLDDGPRQVSELVVAENSTLAGKPIADVTRDHRLIPVAFTPAAGGAPRLLLDVPRDTALSPGDRLVVCGSPADLIHLLERERGELLPGVRWAGVIRRWFRTARRTLLEVDLSVKIATPILFLTIFASVLVFRYGLGNDWTDGLYNTVNIVATGAELRGEDKPEWAKVFLSGLKLVGAALIAGFTAIFTQYLIRAKLGGALEVRRVPDGGHVVVCGLGNIGYRLVMELTAMGERVVAIDKVADNPFIATVRRKGVPTFVGDATLPEVLKQANAATAKAVIAATSSELANLEIALLARETNPKQRVVVRLIDPLFAEAVRDAADVRLAMSIPSLAAPAFAAALFGDRVQTLITAANRTLVVIEIVVDPDDTFLHGKSLRALMLDYRLLPVALGGCDPADLRGHRLKVGDRLTVVVELPDLERLIRREAIPATASVAVDSYPPTARETLITLVRVKRNCSREEAEAILAGGPFTLAEGLTKGEAQELVEQVAREGVTVRIV